MKVKIPIPDEPGQHYHIQNLKEPFGPAQVSSQPTVIAGIVKTTFPSNSDKQHPSLILGSFDGTTEHDCLVEFIGENASGAVALLDTKNRRVAIVCSTDESFQYSKRTVKDRAWNSPKVSIAGKFKWSSQRREQDPWPKFKTCDTRPRQVSSFSKSQSSKDQYVSTQEKENEEPAGSQSDDSEQDESMTASAWSSASTKRSRSDSEKQPRQPKKPRISQAVSKQCSESFNVANRTYNVLREVYAREDESTNKTAPFSTVAIITNYASKHSKAGAFFQSFCLYDPTLPSGHVLTLSGNNLGNNLLDNVQDGDVAVFQDINIKKGSPAEWTGYSMKAKTGFFSRNVLMTKPSEELTVSDFVRPMMGVAKIGEPEIRRAQALARWWTDNEGKIKVQPPVRLSVEPETEKLNPGQAVARQRAVARPTGTRKAPTLAKDMVGNVYCIWTAEVLKVWKSNFDDKSTAYMTDYTENEYFYQFDELQENITRPLGQRVMQVTFWNNQSGKIAALYDEAIKKNKPCFVRLNNLRPKIDPHQLLEGSVHQDDFQTRVSGLELLSTRHADEHLAGLLERRKYYNKFIHHTITGEDPPIDARLADFDQHHEAKPHHDESEPEAEHKPEPKRKQKQKVDEGPVASSSRLPAAGPFRNAPAPARNGAVPITPSTGSTSRQLKSTTSTSSSSDTLRLALEPEELHEPVRFRYDNVPFSNFGELATVAQNSTLHVRCRVLGFHPPKLADWIVGRCQLCQDNNKFDARLLEYCPDHGSGSSKIDLKGHFLLGPASDQPEPGPDEPSFVKVLVQDAEELLPGLELNSAMARNERFELNKLRARLAPIIGQIEEAQMKKQDEVDESMLGIDFGCALTRLTSVTSKRTMYQLHGVSLHGQKAG